MTLILRDSFLFVFLFFFSSLLAFEGIPLFLYRDLEQETVESPLYIHMMFFPWDQNQRLLLDDFQFDPLPYEKMTEKIEDLPNSRVVMWTYFQTREFCLKYYPDIWEVLERFAVRPVMYIDVLRWLVVYHYGGIYWQYDSLPLASSVSCYLPGPDKKIRLFTETIISSKFSKKMKRFPIRKGMSEEYIRVANQVFSCTEPKNKTIKHLIFFLLHRLQTEKVTCDYDILYITGNAALSEYYDLYAQLDPNVELISHEQAQAMLDWNGKGRWRTDKNLQN